MSPPVILTRIINNVEKLNEGMLVLLKAVSVRRAPCCALHSSSWDEPLQEINVYNASTTEVVELWETYARNVRYNLESTKELQEPI